MTKTIDVYLDDWRIAPDGWVQAWTIEELVKLFENKHLTIRYLSLDNDLGLDEFGNKVLDGVDFINKYFIPRGYFCERIYVHSANPVAKENMLKNLESAIKHEIISKDIVLNWWAFPVSTKNRGNVFKDEF